MGDQPFFKTLKSLKWIFRSASILFSFPVYMLTKEKKQAGAELEQAQLKLGFGFISVNLQ